MRVDTSGGTHRFSRDTLSPWLVHSQWRNSTISSREWDSCPHLCSQLLPLPFDDPPMLALACFTVIPMTVKFGGCAPPLVWEMHHRIRVRLPSVTHRRCAAFPDILRWFFVCGVGGGVAPTIIYGWQTSRARTHKPVHIPTLSSKWTHMPQARSFLIDHICLCLLVDSGASAVSL